MVQSASILCHATVSCLPIASLLVSDYKTNIYSAQPNNSTLFYTVQEAKHDKNVYKWACVSESLQTPKFRAICKLLVGQLSDRIVPILGQLREHTERLVYVD